MKPLLFFDIEATGLEPATDRIVSLGMIVGPFRIARLFNPGFAMSDEVIAVHGIRNEDVAKSPRFEDAAEEIFKTFQGVDLAGYNLRNFDIPILWEEFFRAGLEWDLRDVNVIDVSGIFRKKEPRDLSAAVQFYCGRTMENAHNALADTLATADVLEGQRKRYPDLAEMDRAALAKFSHQDDRIDLAGRIVRNDKGIPVYGFGRNKGVAVADDPGFAQWMLRQDWITTQTKIVIRTLLEELSDERDLFS